MKQIKYTFKLFLLTYMVLQWAVENRFSFEENIILLLIIGITIFKEKYCNSIYVVLISLFIVIIAIHFDSTFGILLSMTAFDFMCKNKFSGTLLVIVCEIYFFYNDKSLMLLLMLICICSLLGYIVGVSEEKEKNYKNALDEERRLRYELEQFKMKLLKSSKEVAHLAEVRERNRISREIHDSVGHKTTAILIQLQAAYKLFERDNEKAKFIVYKCINALSDTVTLLRDTVHNIKPIEKLGIEYIQNVIKDFSFCPVKLKFTGDFNALPANQLEIIITNIKEALTNAAKHSGATEVNIFIDINKLYTRLYIADNGVGSSKIIEGLGLGLSGMRERIENIGGSMAISSDNGFMIVCIIPLENREGGEINESLNCR